MLPKPVAEMLARNKKFAANYQKPPFFMQMAPQLKATRAGVVVISCADPRLNPDQILGLDATLRATHVRNAGGRASEAIRSLAILQTIASPGTVVVIHHTDCGTTHTSNEELIKTLIERAPGQKEAIEAIRWDAIGTKPIEQSVKEDIEYLKSSPLLEKDTAIIGLKYDIETGALTEVGNAKSGL